MKYNYYIYVGMNEWMQCDDADELAFGYLSYTIFHGEPSPESDIARPCQWRRIPKRGGRPKTVKTTYFIHNTLEKTQIAYKYKKLQYLI